MFYFIDDIILLMLKLVSNKIDTYLTSLSRHERYLFSVFRRILPAVFRRFSMKLSTSVVVHQTIFYQIIKINKTQLLLKYFLVHEVLNFLKSDGKMFKYYKGLDDVLMFEVVCRHVTVIQHKNKINTTSSKIVFFHKTPIIDYIFSSGILKQLSLPEY